MKTISTLGKILLFLVFIPLLLNGDVTASLDKTKIYKGDVVTLKISATGENIKFPTINSIGGFDVLGRSSSSQIYIVNSKMTKSKSISYTFVPTKSISIPSYKVEIDGDAQYTQPLSLQVLKPRVGKIGDDFIFSLKLSKNSAYMGEAVYATFTFSYKDDLQILDINLDKLTLKHFWIKELNNQPPVQENGYIKQTINYILFPQLSGKQTIPSQLIKIATRNPRTGYIQWKRVLSNEQTLDVKPLPENLTVQGDYTISATVDKTTVKANEPVNLTLVINGTGNIDDIEPFKLDLDEQVVYSDKPVITNKMINNKYGGKFIQKISIISSKDFTIPPVKFKYFNIDQNKTITIETKPFEIKVKGVAVATPKIQTIQTTSAAPAKQQIKTVIKKENSYIKYIYLIVGLVLGGAVVWFVSKQKFVTKDDVSIVTKIKKAKTDKALYEILLPYSGDLKIKSYMDKLEKNLYENKKNKIDKKELIEIFEN